MFLLNEIVEDVREHLLPVDELIFSHNLDYDLFKKGDLVYFEDFDLINLFKFFHIFEYNNYDDLLNKDKLFMKFKPIFDYVNCVGQIKKINKKITKVSKGRKQINASTYFIQFPDGKSVKINDIRYLKLYVVGN